MYVVCSEAFPGCDPDVYVLVLLGDVDVGRSPRVFAVDVSSECKDLIGAKNAAEIKRDDF